MIRPLKTIREEIEKFNSQRKYIVNCDFCNTQILYTANELRGNIIKCPYCGHMQKVLYKNEYDVRLQAIISSSFDDGDSYKV